VTRFQIKRLDRYIGRHALGGFFLTLAVLVKSPATVAMHW
jgi:hypothetical protein